MEQQPEHARADDAGYQGTYETIEIGGMGGDAEGVSMEFGSAQSFGEGGYGDQFGERW